MALFQDLSKFRLPSEARGKPAWIVQLWWIVQLFFFRFSPQALFGWRRFLLRLFGAKIGKNVLIRPTAQFTYPWKVSIGDRSWIGDDVVLYSLANITVGSDTVISQQSYLCTGSHDHTKLSFDLVAEPINIGNQVWIASRAFIAPGVTIADGSVIGMGSMVLDNLPGGMICYGSPAKPVRPRTVSA
jgi:putative colanic acid biosynthesis acetyltransferase WcaF